MIKITWTLNQLRSFEPDMNAITSILNSTDVGALCSGYLQQAHSFYDRYACHRITRESWYNIRTQVLWVLDKINTYSSKGSGTFIIPTAIRLQAAKITYELCIYNEVIHFHNYQNNNYTKAPTINQSNFLFEVVGYEEKIGKPKGKCECGAKSLGYDNHPQWCPAK